MHKFLAIDDNESNLISIEGLIKELYPDAQVRTVLDGLSGIELAKQLNPDVILLDIFMPVMDGYSVCLALKQDVELKDIPVLFMTAMKETRENRLHAMEAGAEGFLTKPIDNVELASMLHAMLKIRLSNLQKKAEKKKLEALVEKQTAYLHRQLDERIFIQEELKKSEERYKAFFEDDITGDFLSSTDGHLIDCNPAFLKMLGFSKKEEALNYNLDSLYPKIDDRDNLLKLVAEKGKLEDYEYTMVDVNGKLLYVVSNIIGVFNEKKELTAIKGYIFNNTQRKIAENELRKLSRAVEQNSSSIVITDDQARIEYVNPKFTELTGYTLEEVMGNNPKILQSGLTTPQTYDSMWNALQLGQEWKGELQNRTKTGELYLEAASISPILDDKGKITHYLAVKEDITEIKRIMDELILTKEKAVESDSLKTAFLMNMSHEIRTPMNGILGFLSLLDEPNLDEESKREYIQIVNSSAQRLLSTINDIIEISRIESGVVEVSTLEVNLVEQMDFYLDFFLPQANAKKLDLVITSQLTGKDAIVMTDRNKMDSILINLIKNAIKFTSKGRIEFGNYLENGKLVFYVKDTGKGIPPERISSIFERFVQADIRLTRTHEGSGLGLSIAKAYATALDGDISVESTMDVGSTFKLSIPYVTCDSLAPISLLKEDEILHPDSTKKTILIAEDDENSYIYLEVILGDEDFTLIHTINGLDTVQALKDNPSIDLILMDLSMPKMNGLEATKEIRKFNTKIPIIAQTAFAFSSDRLSAMDAGCTDYISKPISTKTIKEVVKKYL